MRIELGNESVAWEVRVADGAEPSAMRLHREWNGDCCRLSLENTGNVAQRIAEVVAFRCDMPYEADTPFYGEGFNMLSQYKGTLSSFQNITGLSDAGHYKLPQTDGFFTVYNLLMLYPSAHNAALMAFSSCHRFNGQFRFNPDCLEVVLTCEGIQVPPGATMALEEFFFGTCEDPSELLQRLGQQIGVNHPPLPYEAPPCGWSSWSCYGRAVTEEDVFDNLATIKSEFPDLKFIQLDDGYQTHMGDWLAPNPNFPNGIDSLCCKIKEAGFEPAIWVAPFIAAKDSDLLRDHPDWFVKDDQGQPLDSSTVSFGGWVEKPWYMLDGTHPGAQDYLRMVFRTMREKWHCRYFKLDANTWGALPWGHRHDPNATAIEAYRAGMQALREGAGEGSFVLGCNAALWPSLGTVHGMRVTNDIKYNWRCIRGLAEQGFPRNWQNQALWISDPDNLVLCNHEQIFVGFSRTDTDVSENEFSFHAAYILASGGMILAGDRMMALQEEHKQIISKLVPPSGNAAVFDDRDFTVGRIKTDDGWLLCLFNWGDTETRSCATLEAPCDLYDYWTDTKLAENVTRIPFLSLPAHSARVVACVG
ncbi:MAG: alpha-galactosidase [Verrucomicrobia bacterium]|jgi:alpha-galactosidase|nr:alpha-galactosidase [Verrucomicrobiota bacterium]